MIEGSSDTRSAMLLGYPGTSIIGCE